MKILVTVKAYPGLGNTYGETVCVAGVRLDTPNPTWVRLWPVGFRELPESIRFKKWQIIDIDGRQTSKDQRPESYHPNMDTLQLGPIIESKNGWKKRTELLGDLLGQTTLCALQRDAATNRNAPSLGLVKVRAGATAVIVEGPVWTPEKELLANIAAQPHLFRDEPLTPLEPPQLQVQYKWHCMDPDCNGHTQSSCDWEVGVAARSWSTKYGSDLHEAMLKTFRDRMLDPAKNTHFFVGNQHQWPSTFMILGTYYPPKNP